MNNQYDDVIRRARNELWEFETYGSFWNGQSVMLELLAAVLELKNKVVE